MKKIFGFLVILILSTKCADKKNDNGYKHSVKSTKMIYELSIKDTFNIKNKVLTYLAENTPSVDTLVWIANFLTTKEINRDDLAKIILYKIDLEDRTDIANFMLSKLMEKENQLDSAIYFIKKSIEKSPKIEYLSHIIEFFCSNGKHDSAIIFVNNCIEQNPKDYNIKLLKGNILVQQAKYKQAIELYNEVEHKTSIIQLYGLRGFSYSELGEFEFARKDIEMAFSLNDTSSLNYSTRSLINYNFSNYNQALDDINIAIKKNDTKLASHYFIRAMIKKELKMYNNAIEDLEIMRKLDSLDFRYFSLKGRVFQQKGNLLEAKKYYELALVNGDSSCYKYYSELKNSKLTEK